MRTQWRAEVRDDPIKELFAMRGQSEVNAWFQAACETDASLDYVEEFADHYAGSDLPD